MRLQTILNYKIRCRGCSSKNFEQLIDLGEMPISNNLLSKSSDFSKEPRYPLEVIVCLQCGLAQLSHNEAPESLFSPDYVYFSSFSDTWLKHCENFANEIILTENLGKNSLVIEIASNDGSLLKYFKDNFIPVLGIEPTRSTAKYAQEIFGIDTRVEFFSQSFSASLKDSVGTANLIIGNNVLAHVPDINDFVAGLKNLLQQNGLITLEFPHLLNLIRLVQFDTIYHEHFSYLSLMALAPIFEKHGLRIFNVRSLQTHGGSLRIYICHASDLRQTMSTVQDTLDLESDIDPRNIEVIGKFRTAVNQVRLDLYDEIMKLNHMGQTVAAYGAAAKGNTFLNYAKVDSSHIKYVVDRNPAKIGKYLPGSQIPVVDIDHLCNNEPDVVLILPWNLANEVVDQVRSVTTKDIRFLVAIPNLRYL
jgi:SAM-dependent methyltransferase